MSDVNEPLIAAIREELQLTRKEFRSEFGSLRTELQLTREETKSELGSLRTELGSLRTEVGFALDTINAKLSGISDFLLSSERDYRALEARVFDLEQWRKKFEKRRDQP